MHKRRPVLKLDLVEMEFNFTKKGLFSHVLIRVYFGLCLNFALESLNMLSYLKKKM